jgi:hypothetical protein
MVNGPTCCAADSSILQPVSLHARLQVLMSARAPCAPVGRVAADDLLRKLATHNGRKRRRLVAGNEMLVHSILQAQGKDRKLSWAVNKYTGTSVKDLAMLL